MSDDMMTLVSSFSPIIYVVFGGLFGGLITYLTTSRLEERKSEIRDRQKRREAYSQLMGMKILLRQIYISTYEYGINADYHLHLETSHQFRNNDEMKAHKQESLRCMQLTPEMVAKKAKAEQDMWKVIGSIQTLFSITPNQIEPLEQMEEHFKKFEPEEIESSIHECLYPDPEGLPEGLPKEYREPFLHDWLSDKKKELDQMVKEKIDTPLNGLLASLKDEIDREG